MNNPSSKLSVIGGTGFLGNRLLKKLFFLNHSVFNYDIIDGYDILSGTSANSLSYGSRNVRFSLDNSNSSCYAKD